MTHMNTAYLAITLTAIVFLAGCTSSPKTTYMTEFTEISETPSTQQGFVPAGKTLDLNFQATSKNITRVSIQLAFYDDSGDGCPDIMGLAVDSPFPDALYLPTKAGQSNTTMTINLTIQHMPTVKKSTSKTELQEYLDGVSNSQGTGKWTISIADVTASPCSNPKTTDPGNNWVMMISPFVFEGNVSEA